MNAIKYIQLLSSKLNLEIHSNQYCYENLSQSNNDQSIIEDKFNQDMSQEINLSNHVQYNNYFFQDLENVIREDYNQCFETFNQQTNTYFNNQYIDENRTNNPLYYQQFYQSNNVQSKIENNFNTAKIESFSREITSSNYCQYNNGDFENFNQESENNLHQNISQSFSQEINSFDCFQYNNNHFQYFQNVI